jgi:hypothetical protein
MHKFSATKIKKIIMLSQACKTVHNTQNAMGLLIIPLKIICGARADEISTAKLLAIVATLAAKLIVGFHHSTPQTRPQIPHA